MWNLKFRGEYIVKYQMGVHVSSDPCHWPMRELVTSACSPIGPHYQTKAHNNVLSSGDDVLGPFLQKFIISDKKQGIKKMESTEKLSKSQKNHLRKSKRCSQRPKLPDLPSFRLNTVVTRGSKHSLVIIFLKISVTKMWFRFSAQ